jgi:heavy metal translocating P-type ATPase
MSVEITCGLCDLPCTAGPLVRQYEGKEVPFCCMGCANVYAILLESGVIASGQNLRETEVFRRSLELGLISRREEKQKNPALDPNAPTEEMLLQVNGMWCSACSWLIEHALVGLPGVISAEVYFASDLAKVRYCPQYLPPEKISARIDRLGYKASVYTGETSAAKGEIHDLLMRLGVAAFLWANIMAFSTILYVGYFEKIAASANQYLPYLLLVLATPLVFYSAYPILRSAFMGLRNGQIRMEALLSMGILTAYFFSAVQTLRGQTHLYFDTAAAIVALVLTGKLIERVAKERAARSLALLYRFMPKKVRLLSGGSERFITIEALTPGQIFVVKVGERIPADGVIDEGESYCDESLLSGESTPIAKHIGAAVASGSLNVGGVIHVRASRTGDESALAQIIHQVEHALSTRAPIERTVDRISRLFVPGVIVLALASFFILFFLHAGVEVALMRATTILVIACPCALGLATPLAITAAVGNASQSGLLIRDSAVLESMGKIDTVVMDKTGTLTHGDFRLTDFVFVLENSPEIVAGKFANPDAAEELVLRERIAMLAAIESYSEHLLGRAVVDWARNVNARLSEASEVEVLKGEGIRGKVEGRNLFIGNRRIVESSAAQIDDELEKLATSWQEVGRTVAYFGWDGTVKGAFGFGDQVKSGAREMIENLRARGMSVSIVSGDAWATTRFVAQQIGVESCVAEATPGEKSRIVEELQRAGKRVAVIGDGVNDAPALAQAEIGIALGTGAQIAMSAAPVVLVSGRLARIESAFDLAAKTTRIVKQNLFWAFFYNIFGITLALYGVLNPILAAAAMLLSSVSVIANSMRLSKRATDLPVTTEH